MDDPSTFGNWLDSDRTSNIMLNIYFLSRCEFLVCTLSSNVARVVYEVWSLKYMNLTDKLVSLDSGYYFG